MNLSPSWKVWAERLGRWALAILYFGFAAYAGGRVIGPSASSSTGNSLLDGGLLGRVVFLLLGVAAIAVGLLLLLNLLSASKNLLLARLTLAGIFLFAAFPKILDPLGFAQDITNYQILPDVLVNLTAIILPWVEAFAALALLSGFAADGATLLVTLQMVAFIAMLGQAWFRDLDIDCGCFGHGTGGRSVAKALVEDWAFLAIALWVLSVRLRRTPAPKPATT